MSQPELARAAGIRQPTISNIESDRNKGSGYVAQLAAALKCSAHWLATGKGKKEPTSAPGAADSLTRGDQIVLDLFNGGLRVEQQLKVLAYMKSAAETNEAIGKQLRGKVIRTVSDGQIEAAFGALPVLKPRGKVVPKPRREPGTAMDDFLEPE